MVGTVMFFKVCTSKHNSLDKKLQINSRKKVIKNFQSLPRTSSNHKKEFIGKTEANQLKSAKKICRVCLKDGVIPIYGNKGTDNISQELNLFGDINVRVDDIYPKYLCGTCHATLLNAILFRKISQHSDQFLKQQAQQQIIKNEEIQVENDHTREYEEVECKKIENSKESANDKKHSNINACKEKEIKDVKKIKEYHCSVCNFTSQNIMEYKEHKNGKATCSVCSNLYEHSYLQKHKALHDTQKRLQNSYMCDICGKFFYRKEAFKRHRVIHFNSLPYKCTLCPYRGRFSYTLKMHMRIHTGEKKFQCTQCPYKSIDRSNLNKHMLTHRKKLFKCELCGRGCVTKRYLETHFKHIHLGIKDHICDVCNKPFATKKQLFAHQKKIHNQEKRKCGMPLYLRVDTNMET